MAAWSLFLRAVGGSRGLMDKWLQYLRAVAESRGQMVVCARYVRAHGASKVPTAEWLRFQVDVALSKEQMDAWSPSALATGP